jgi:small multidrug resistance pump
MSVFSGYIYLSLGILTGISANSFAKISDGFSKLNPTIACLIFMFVCMFSLSKAMSVIPVGFTYATYGGLTITAIALFGIIKYNQIPNFYGVVGISLIVIGVILLNTLGKTS